MITLEGTLQLLSPHRPAVERTEAMTDSRRIRVMIVDEHNMVRRGLATFLRIVPDLELVGQATNGFLAVRMCERILPDVILMDLLMPVMNGIEATRIIRERFPGVQVIALTSFQEKELVREVIEAGAISYLLKNVSVEELAQAIRAAHAGRSTLAPEATQALAQAGGQNQQTSPSIGDGPQKPAHSDG